MTSLSVPFGNREYQIESGSQVVVVNPTLEMGGHCRAGDILPVRNHRVLTDGLYLVLAVYEFLHDAQPLEQIEQRDLRVTVVNEDGRVYPLLDEYEFGRRVADTLMSGNTTFPSLASVTDIRSEERVLSDFLIGARLSLNLIFGDDSFRRIYREGWGTIASILSMSMEVRESGQRDVRVEAEFAPLPDEEPVPAPLAPIIPPYNESGETIFTAIGGSLGGYDFRVPADYRPDITRITRVGDGSAPSLRISSGSPYLSEFYQQAGTNPETP